MQIFAINVPSLLIIGFLIGVILIIRGNRDLEDLTKRSRLLKVGISIIGIMIPVTPLSWYGYWVFSSGMALMIIDYAIIAISIVVGIIVIYKGLTTYPASQ